MLSPNELKKGMKILFNNEPHEILEAKIMFKGRGHTVVQARVKNLATGAVTPQSFHPSDTFEEIELKKFEAKFLYAQPGKNLYFFCEKDNPAKRFDLGKEQIGETSIFLTPNKIVEAIVFEDKIINIALPVKTQLKVMETPPGVRGDRSQSGTKQATLEGGAKVNVPLFVQEGDIIEINTETGEYTRRIDKE